MEYLIYGANGYTGELITRLAIERGHRPILAGRSAGPVEALASKLGLAARVFALDDVATVDRGLEGVGLVLHCAGPFAHTARPMALGCLRRRVHYLDVTGEIPVFEQLAALHDKAETAGVLLLPGVGFDVVPSDCLAVHLKNLLPTATRLRLALQVRGGLSRGTASTIVENLNRGGAVRKQGKLVAVPACWKTRTINLGRGPRICMTIPWGDLTTAWHSTGIPDIEVYLAAPMAQRILARASRVLTWLPGVTLLQRELRRRIHAGAPGPTEAQRARGYCLLWGEARDDHGERVVSRLRCPEGYTTTALAALACVERVLAGQWRPGFQTPGKLYGADLVMTLPGVERQDG